MSNSITTPTNRSLFLDPGPLRPLVDQFICGLASQGHTVLTVRGYEDGARHFAAWCRATIKVRIPDNQDEKVLGAWSEGRA